MVVAASDGVSTVEDIVVGPLLPASSKSRIQFHCSKPEAELTHLQGRHHVDVAKRQVFPAEPEVTRRFDDPVVYAGPLFLHFAHFIADSIHRLWVRQVDPALRNAKVAFHVKADLSPQLPSWAVETFELLGLREDDIIFINQPTFFKKLILPVQGRVLGGVTRIADYQQLFPFNSEPLSRVAEGPRQLYVSRSRHRHSGCYLGETYVERCLAEAGFTTIFPEDYSIPQAVRLFMGAENIVFAEGGALQLLQLCGKIDAWVFVIGRRRATTQRFGDIVANAAPKHQLFESALDGICLSTPVNREPLENSKAANFIDIGKLKSSLSTFFGIQLPVGDENEINNSIRQDLIDYLLDARIRTKGLTPQVAGDQLLRVRSLAERFGI